MGRVHSPGAEIHEERFVRRDLLGVGYEADSLIGQVLGQMVTFLGRLGWLYPVVVVSQIRIVLVGVAAQEAIVTLETAAEGPAVVRAGGRDLVGRRQMPFADSEGIVTVLQQHFRQEAVLKWDITVVAGKTGRGLSDGGHGVGVMIAAGQNA